MGDVDTTRVTSVLRGTTVNELHRNKRVTSTYVPRQTSGNTHNPSMHKPRTRLHIPRKQRNVTSTPNVPANDAGREGGCGQVHPLIIHFKGPWVGARGAGLQVRVAVHGDALRRRGCKQEGDIDAVSCHAARGHSGVARREVGNCARARGNIHAQLKHTQKRTKRRLCGIGTGQGRLRGKAGGRSPAHTQVEIASHAALEDKGVLRGSKGAHQLHHQRAHAGLSRVGLTTGHAGPVSSSWTRSTETRLRHANTPYTVKHTTLR